MSEFLTYLCNNLSEGEVFLLLYVVPVLFTIVAAISIARFDKASNPLGEIIDPGLIILYIMYPLFWIWLFLILITRIEIFKKLNWKRLFTSNIGQGTYPNCNKPRYERVGNSYKCDWCNHEFGTPRSWWSSLWND